MDATRQHIGRHIKIARKLVGCSQERLGEELGVTFQQVQKYENGKNRVASCRLAKIAELLDQDIGFFFPPRATATRRAGAGMSLAPDCPAQQQAA